MEIKACIFDLDGVIVSTSEYHYLAWKKLSHALGFTLSREQNEEMKGISRMDSLECVLAWGDVKASEKDKIKYAAAKNTWYLEYLNELSVRNILPGVIPFLNDLKNRGIKIAIGSASKNAVTVLHKLKLSSFFETIIDGNSVVNSKPDPEVFIKGAMELGVPHANTVVFEDSAKGIEAAISGGFMTVGIGTIDILGAADHVIPGFENFDFTRLQSLFSTLKKVKI